MQSKALLSLLLLAPAALASPVAQSDDYYSEYANDDYEDLATLSPEDLYSSEIAFIQTAVPTSILTVLETAIPSTWFEALADPSAQYSIYEAAASGVYPDWYSKLPQSVKAWVTGDATDDSSPLETSLASLLPSLSSEMVSSGMTVATTTGPSSSDATKSSDSSSSAATSTSSSDSSSDASSSSATPSGSVSPSSTGNGAMPMATGGVAASVAGVVGLLGLAVAL